MKNRLAEAHGGFNRECRPSSRCPTGNEQRSIGVPHITRSPYVRVVGFCLDEVRVTCGNDAVFCLPPVRYPPATLDSYMHGEIKGCTVSTRLTARDNSMNHTNGNFFYGLEFVVEQGIQNLFDGRENPVNGLNRHLSLSVLFRDIPRFRPSPFDFSRLLFSRKVLPYDAIDVCGLCECCCG